MATAEAPMAPITQIEGANLLNLIIVDDERAIREACREIASSLGLKVFVAESAEHACRPGRRRHVSRIPYTRYCS